MVENSNWYKYYFVPMCGNTTSKTPEKMFISVPIDEGVRRLWCNAAGCPNKKFRKISYACEGHFDLKNDIENYMYVKTMGGRKILKKGAIPRYFACQQKMDIDVKEEQDYYEKNAEYCYEKNAESAKKKIKTDTSFPVPDVCCKVEDATVQAIPSTSQILDEPMSTNIIHDESPNIHKYQKDFGVQVNRKPSYRSIGINCKITSITKSTAVSPIRFENSAVAISTSEISATEPSITSSGNEVLDSSFAKSKTSATDTDEYAAKSTLIKENIFSTTKFMIEDNPLLFLGIPKMSMQVINEIQSSLKILVSDIYIVLQKIRLKRSNAELSYYFGISESQVSRIFTRSITKLSALLKKLITWPPKETIFKNLPIQFRYRYQAVQSIIDCFEIEIEKPSNAVHQALSWSEYKKCNTAKYLISATPDGLINYISSGYGGRTSDLSIVENSGYLDILPSGCAVLADRGFKHLESILHARGCKLIRPPSVLTNTKPSKADVIKSKQIASVRIHIERVIRRIREFKLLDIHSRIEHNTLRHLDDTVVIAASLINLQSPIINQD